MSGPITWRNVQGRGASDAARLLDGASRSINTGLNAFGSAIEGAQQNRQDAYDRQVESNTDAYLDELAGFGNANELERAQETGSLDRLRASFGDAVDRDAVRGAADSRLQELYAQDDANLDREIKPLVDSIRAEMVSNPSGAAALIEENRDVLSRGGLYGSLLGDADNRSRDLKVREQDDARILREERGRTANENFDKLLSGISRRTDDPIEARALMLEQLESTGDLQFVQGRLGEIDQNIADRYALSAPQLEELTRFSDSQNAIADAEIAQIDMELQQAEEGYSALEAFNAEIAEPASVGDAVKYAGDLGWDKQRFGRDSLSKQINDSAENFSTKVNESLAARAKERGEEAQEIDPGLVGAITREAISRMGAPDEGWYDNNLVQSELEALMLTIYDEHTQRLTRKDQLNALRIRHREKTSEYRGKAASSIQEKLKQFRENNSLELLRRA